MASFRKMSISIWQHGIVDTNSRTSRVDHVLGSISVDMKRLRNWECLCHDSNSAGSIFERSMKAMAFCSTSGEIAELFGLLNLRFSFFSGASVDSSDGSGLGGSNLGYLGGRPSRGLLKSKKRSIILSLSRYLKIFTHQNIGNLIVHCTSSTNMRSCR